MMRAPADGATEGTRREVLEGGLAAHFDRPVRILAVEAKALDTFSTHPIERLSVTLDGGRRLSIIFKRLLPGEGRDPGRTVLAYRRIVAGRFGTPELYASVSDPATSRWWLFLEDVGRERLDRCDVATWVLAFRWLAGMHAAHLGRDAELGGHGCLLQHTPAFHGELAAQARRRLAASAPWALGRFDDVTGRLAGHLAETASRPRTLLHGDLSAKNVMVQGMRVRPVDWEWAAIGVPAWDVAKLASGWGEAKPRLLAAYLGELRSRVPGVDAAAFSRDLDVCDALWALWYLRWWTEPGADDGFVARILTKVEGSLGRG